MATFTTHSSMDLNAGVVKMIKWHWNGPHSVAAICLDGSVCVIDIHVGCVGLKKICHHDHILDFFLMDDRGKIVTCGEDGTCKVFDMYVEDPDPIVELPAEE
ncbi:hypothetical protein ACOME3_002682 [Neoechinorhynchus agilis]